MPDEAKIPEKKKVIKFDPNKGYKWQPTDTFWFSGEDYSVILATLRSILETKEAKTVFLAQEASEALQRALILSVERGVAQEFKEDDNKKD